jgi:DNA-binding response OmpR family regulator/HPt (histidine-containing phosphotransfer) domain-containing protein
MRVMQGPGQAEEQFHAAIRALWEEARPGALERIGLLEDAVAALLGGELDAETLEAARSAAHKLAGSLGTFGVAEGTVIARRLEAAFETPPAHADVPALAAQVLALRRAVEAAAAEAPPSADAGARVLLAGLPAARSAAVVAAARGRGWVLTTAAGAPEAGGAGVALLGPGVGDAVAVAAELTRAGVTVAATDDAADRVELVRAGARRLLPADLPADAVADELAELERGRREAAATIVALDDDPVVLGLLDAALSAAGHRLVAVEDPLAFWAALEAAPPDLIVLDVQMPEVSGVEICRALRAHPRWRAVPVLFLTATGDGAAIGELFAAGADDYVQKPIEGEELVARIEGRLERTRRLTAGADVDERTGALRQAAAAALFARGLAVAERLGQPFTIAALRIDGLDERPDREPLLATAATVLRDVLGPVDVIARWPGDVLVVGMLGLDGHDARARLGEAIERVRRGDAPFTLSAGLAELPGDGRTPDDLVAAAIAARRAAEAAGGDRVAGTGTAAEPDRVDIVVVEDDEVLARLILHALETRGYRTRWIDDGERATRELGGERPPLRADLVLLDWDLPGRDGLTVLRLLGADGVLQRTKVVMLTLRASERESLASLELGATDHIAKPFSLPVLMQRIRRVLAR